MLNFDDYYGNEYFDRLLATRIAHLRVINTSPDMSVNIYVNGMLFASNVGYLMYSPYRPVAPGRYDIAIFPVSGSMQPLKRETVVIAARSFVTFAVYGMRDRISARTLIDSTMGSPKGRASIKVAHFAPTTAAVDVYASNKELFSDLKYGEVTKYEALSPATYMFQLKKAGTSQTIYTLPSQRLIADNTYTAYITGLENMAPALKMTFILDGVSALREQNRMRARGR